MRNCEQKINFQMLLKVGRSRVPQGIADKASPGCAISANGSGPGSISGPFDGWDIPSGRSAIAEVYPALWSRSFAKEDRTGDQHDSFSIAAWLSRADRNCSLAAFLKPELTPPERKVAQVEGWILGVPGLIRSDLGRKGIDSHTVH